MVMLDWEAFMSKKPTGLPSPPDLEAEGQEGAAEQAPAKGQASPPPRKRGAIRDKELFVRVARRIVELRKANHMSQAQLARASECPVSTVFSAEQGVHNISLSTLQKLAEALKVRIRDLIPEPEPPAPAPAPAPPPPPMSAPPAISTETLKMVDSVLATHLTEMGRATYLIQQVRKALEEVGKPEKTSDRNQP
ncbi:helix-turn-helix transcriptional regulator [Roseomonas sp. E05]|uniref:helix-turn-helix transcriptional regulator n=1 Tax=Roseomonas sp. E05 TaxID=3046310 RepID=UPI0024BB39EC|nr:helix-turn-helix transcriptional regulator [Roseomonas sp. E05]MDJ0390683.1 helix-turn-helix transcriptional regulator [Roseomonas sp. E05]